MPRHPAHRLRQRAGLLLLAALLTSLLLPAGRASANAFADVQQAFALSGQAQTIAPCKFSASVLAQAESSVPNDAQQYDQNLIAAIQQALQQRAGGACRLKHAPAPAATPAGTPAPPSAPRTGPGTPLQLGSPIAATDSGLPIPIAILAILAGLLLIGGGALWTARLRGWDPEWLARSRHSWSEAGYRVSGVWSDLGDWLRGIPH